MPETNKKKEIATEIFKSNSFINTVYITSDNIPFSEISDAENYARKKFDNLDKRKLNTFKREVLKVEAVIKKQPKITNLIEEIKKSKSADEIKQILESDHRPIITVLAKKRLEHFPKSKPQG